MGQRPKPPAPKLPQDAHQAEDEGQLPTTNSKPGTKNAGSKVGVRGAVITGAAVLASIPISLILLKCDQGRDLEPDGGTPADIGASLASGDASLGIGLAIQDAEPSASRMGKGDLGETVDPSTFSRDYATVASNAQSDFDTLLPDARRPSTLPGNQATPSSKGDASLNDSFEFDPPSDWDKERWIQGLDDVRATFMGELSQQDDLLDRAQRTGNVDLFRQAAEQRGQAILVFLQTIERSGPRRPLGLSVQPLEFRAWTAIRGLRKYDKELYADLLAYYDKVIGVRPVIEGRTD